MTGWHLIFDVMGMSVTRYYIVDASKISPPVLGGPRSQEPNKLSLGEPLQELVLAEQGPTKKKSK